MYQKIGDIKRKIPKITVHGRFQPPLHINHWNYVSQAFKIADKVTILITNPYLSESKVNEAPHRNDPQNNPFSYEQRVRIFTSFLKKMGIARSKYEFRPFNITNQEDWEQTLDVSVPNLVNTYGEWSLKKLENFIKHGYKTIRSEIPKSTPVSGTDIRKVLKAKLSRQEMTKSLIEAGYMKQAIPGLFTVLKSSQ